MSIFFLYSCFPSFLFFSSWQGGCYTVMRRYFIATHNATNIYNGNKGPALMWLRQSAWDSNYSVCQAHGKPARVLRNPLVSRKWESCCSLQLFSCFKWTGCRFDGDVCVCVFAGEVWPVLAKQRDWDIRTHSGHSVRHGRVGDVLRSNVCTLQGMWVFQGLFTQNWNISSVLWAFYSWIQNGSSEKREVRQFQFTAWPDHGDRKSVV